MWKMAIKLFLFTFFVADFSGKIKVDNRKILLIHVGIKSTLTAGNIFHMRKKDMRKRLALFYKWGNEPVELIKFFRGEIDAAAGGRTEFQRGIMGMFGAVEKEIMGTTALLRTSVTDIRRFF